MHGKTQTQKADGSKPKPRTQRPHKRATLRPAPVVQTAVASEGKGRKGREERREPVKGDELMPLPLHLRACVNKEP